MKRFIDHLTLKGIVVVLAMLGAFGIAVVDTSQRNPFMTIAVTTLGAYFGAEVPGQKDKKNKTNDKEGVDDGDVHE